MKHLSLEIVLAATLALTVISVTGFGVVRHKGHGGTASTEIDHRPEVTVRPWAREE